MPSNLRPTKINVSESAVKHNINIQLQQLQNGQQMFAVVKANGYGHGSVQISKWALEAGAAGLAVATLDEALELRNAGISAPILVLGPTDIKFFPIAADKDISLTMSDKADVDAALDFLYERPLKVHLAVDTGMNRIGFTSTEDFKAALDNIGYNENVIIEGVFTHFATADELDESQFIAQNQVFEEYLQLFSELPKFVHVSNSATNLFHSSYNRDLVRTGIAIYGLNPSGGILENDESKELIPAMELVSEISMIKQVKPHQPVSYGATYHTEGNEWIATIPIGYADGYDRRLQGFTVKIANQFYPIVGRVCMDQLMVKVDREFPVGTEVTLMEADNQSSISAEAIAEKLGTISYEVVCGFSDRIPRNYIS